MVWIGFVICQKFCCDFMAWTFVLVAPVRPVLHRVLCSNETIPNTPKTLRKAPKHEFRVQCRGSGAFIAKKPRRLCGTNFCINMLHRVSCSDETVPNAPKHYKMHENLSFGSNGANKLRLLRKIPTGHIVLHQLHEFGPFCALFWAVKKQSQTQPDGRKCSKTRV